MKKLDKAERALRQLFNRTFAILIQLNSTEIEKGWVRLDESALRAYLRGVATAIATEWAYFPTDNDLKVIIERAKELQRAVDANYDMLRLILIARLRTATPIKEKEQKLIHLLEGLRRSSS